MVNASLIKPDGNSSDLSNPMIDGTTYSFTTQLDSFGENDVGDYTCNTTVTPRSSIFLTGMSQQVSNTIEMVITGK